MKSVLAPIVVQAASGLVPDKIRQLSQELAAFHAAQEPQAQV